MYNDLKIAYIYGDNPIDGGNYNGITETIYIDDEASHIEYMIDFFKTHFKDDEYLQQNIRNWTANQVGLYLKELGHIVFFNGTSYRNNQPKNGKKEGIFILPDELTEEQVKALEDFKYKIADYHTVQIWQNFYRDENGILTCTNLTNSNSEKSVTELLDVAIKKNSAKEK